MQRAAKLSEALESVRVLAKDEPLTLGRIIDELSERGHAIICVVLSLPFLQPVPLAGLSTVLGTIIILLGGLLAAGLPPWLPQRLRARAVPPQVVEKVVDLGQRIMRRIERYVRPRGRAIHGHRTARLLAGAVIAASGFLLALPFPIPMSNMLPAAAIIAVALGMLEEDGFLVVAGYVAFVVATLLIGGVLLLPLLALPRLL